MRNLRVTAFAETVIAGDGEKLSAAAWDNSDDSIICAYGPESIQPTITLKRKAVRSSSKIELESSQQPHFETITSWDAPCPLPDLEHDEILLMHYFADAATTTIVLAGGDLVLVREQPEPGQEAIEIVGSIDVGISAAAWAPDEEVLAVVTRADNLVLMSRFLEPLTETLMTAGDLQASRHVSVGWGKKETQFQGKRAKAMRDPTMPERVDEGEFSPYEDNKTSISWRGDAAFLAINSIIPGHRRVIRVYSREGVLDSVSEPVDGLESALSWRPAGNLIASIQRTTATSSQEKLQVVFFERNGLRHGEFDLRLQNSDMTPESRRVRLQWNIDSSVLAVSFPGSVQFWTMGNYHYYLKQHVQLSSQDTTIPLSIRWHQEKPLICLVRGTHAIFELELDLSVCRGTTVSPVDYGTVAVIDGQFVKLTVMRQANVPPPMSFCEIDAKAVITDCAISRNSRQIAVLSKTSLLLYQWKTASSQPSLPYQPERFTNEVHLHKKYDILKLFGGIRNCMKCCFAGEDKLYVLCPAQRNETARCILIEPSSPAENPIEVNVNPATQDLISDIYKHTVWAVSASSATMVDSTDLSGMSMFRFDVGHSNQSIFGTSPKPELAGFNDSTLSFQQVYRTSKGTLVAGAQIITRDCTSFIVTDTHLIFTTSQHLLKFVHLVVDENFQVPGDTPEIDERCRSVERGAKIVTVMPSTYAVVLQMPRGNLETIYPRIMVLTGIRKSLESQQYRAAFLSCQVHQVDMNILCDYLPQGFLTNIPKFIEDLVKPNRIDEFLSKLREEDVTETLYKDTLKAPNALITNKLKFPLSDASNGIQTDGRLGKVNQICDGFISILNTKGPRYLQNVITAHVCKRPADLTAALMLVSSLKNNDSEEADLAVSHLCFLTDTNRLYDAALSLYDLDLTLMVAQNAQRDPREYMPFLQSLQALPSLRRHFEIDNHLRRYSKALVSLHSLQVHEELLTYMTKHGLYTTAMELYKYDTNYLPAVTMLYAQHLEALSQNSSAAMLYESLGKFESAFPLYALTHQWRESLTCASLVPLESSKLLSLATSLATTCAEESRDYRSAANIYVDYLHDIPGAARLLSKGSYFAEASRILALHNLTDEINTILDPGLTEKFGEIIELVADCKSQLGAQLPRIDELRKKAEEDPLAFYGGDAEAMAADGIDIPDNVSLAPTDATTAGGQSLFTRYGSNASKFGGTVASNVSRKTSKTKRREERKRARGKKGSVYEEEYLVNSVSRLLERVNDVQDEVRRLISGLLRRGLREQAAKVDEVMIEITLLCENARRQVWQVSSDGQLESKDTTMYNVNGEGRPPGADGVFWDSQQETAGTATGTGIGKKQALTVKKWTQTLLVSK